jgi:hypothetical protein
VKRSPVVTVGIVQAIAAAALAAGCGSRGAQTPQEDRSWENCVDRNGRVVSEQQCQQDESRRSSPGFMPLYFWYYTRGFQPLAVGATATGGSHTRPAYGTPVRPSAFPNVSRGGFGRTGSAHPSAAT